MSTGVYNIAAKPMRDKITNKILNDKEFAKNALKAIEWFEQTNKRLSPIEPNFKTWLKELNESDNPTAHKNMTVMRTIEDYSSLVNATEKENEKLAKGGLFK